MLNFKRSANLFRGTLSALLAVTVCGLSASSEPAYAQRAANLFTMCKFIGYAENNTNSPYDVVIGRELFTAIAAMRSEGGSSAICRIRPSNSANKYKTLKLAFGMQDQNVRSYGCRKPITVNVYLDGNLQESRSLQPGEGAFLLIPVSRISSLTVEVPENNCNQYGYVYFTQAILEPISTSPGNRY
jgi:hypothetical protein